MTTDLNSPGFFKLVAQGSWPPGEKGLDAFLELDCEDVNSIVKCALRKSPRGRTWQGLQHLMEQKSYVRVREMGEVAATVWARHLGVVDEPDVRAGGRYEDGVRV